MSRSTLFMHELRPTTSLQLRNAQKVKSKSGVLDPTLMPSTSHSMAFLYRSPNDDDENVGDVFGSTRPRDTTIQIIFSLALGVSAFLAFCVLRPRWAGLYAARKKQKDEALALPELPLTLFGWIRPLWKITDQQVLASAGLDAYVFLAFFKMAMKFLLITLFFALVVIKPVHDAYPEDETTKPGSPPRNQTDLVFGFVEKKHNGTEPKLPGDLDADYLWMYVAFAYLFSAIAIYLIVSETKHIIEVRQEFLGAQTTITDRTIRLSGIPSELQSEDKIKEFIESLDIGKVDSVMLVRQWKELDQAVSARMDTLRRLEEAHTIYTGRRKVERNLETLPISQPPPPEPAVASTADEEQGEDARLIQANGHPGPAPYGRVRPQTTIRYGFLKTNSKQVDAIDYFEEKLRLADEHIKELRTREFAPMPLAFVTMDSVAAAQMAVQAVLDPSPLQLIAKQCPAPSDIIWPNTYISRRDRFLRSWSITAVILLLTIFWSAIFVPIAGLLSTKAIARISPGAGKFLDEHDNIRSLVGTQLPTLIASLLFIVVPYLYYYLSWLQGMMSQSDIELSTISKNFFFTFFNFFIIFTIFGTASKFYQFFEKFGDAIGDFRNVAYTLAFSLQQLLGFYTNFIILQGVGLFPLRLLEMGSVSLYPVFLMGAKTPRDFAELIQPPIFSYGFYLPTALLIFIICIVYSVLRSSWQVLLAGLIYFFLGSFVYKYQLLYAMDHLQHSTGYAWVMICDRIFLGLGFFQLTIAGQLLLKKAVTRSVLMVPLLIATLWISVLYGRSYKPLMKYIALRSVKRGEQYMDSVVVESHADNPATGLATENNVWADGGATQMRYNRETDHGLAVDESRETGLRYINPSLVVPLKGVWIADEIRSDTIGEGQTTGDESV